MAIKSKARHDLTLRSIKREIAAGRDVAYWLDKAYTHLDSGLLTEDDIAEVEALAQAYYDALDAEDAADQELEEDVIHMAIKQYSLKKDGKTYLASCFQVKEFACRASDTILIDDELVVVLQCIREHFGKPVTITSGYRTASHNAKVGGSRSSQHIQGRAADFWVEGVPVATVAAYAESLMPGWGGVGRYPKDAAHPTRKTGWVHVDTRPNKSRWTL